MSRKRKHNSKILKRKKRLNINIIFAQCRRWLKPFLVTGFVLWLGVWIWLGGVVGQVSSFGYEKWLDVSSDAGFRVDRILVEGRDNIDARFLMSVIDVQQGEALFSSDLMQIHQRLTSLEWVSDSVVRRHAPSDLHIFIKERVPVALLKDDDEVALVDLNGRVIDVPVTRRFNHYLIVDGDNVEEHIRPLFRVLALYPDIKSNLDMAQWVGNRRWNLVGKNNMMIKMPDIHLDKALQRLQVLNNEMQVLSSSLNLLDLRYDDRIIVRSDNGVVKEVGYEL